jgi:hypothetical protein
MRTSKKKNNINKKLSLKKEHHKKKSKNKIFKINGGAITDNESKLIYIFDLAKKSVENDSENLYSLLITDKFIDIIQIKYSDSIIADMQKILITKNYQEFNKYYDKIIADKVNNLIDSVKEGIVKSVFHNNDDLNSYLEKTGLNYEIGIKFLWLGLIFCILNTNILWRNIDKDTDLNKLIIKHTKKKLSINKFGGSPPSGLNPDAQRVYNDIVEQLKHVVNPSLLSTLQNLCNNMAGERDIRDNLKSIKDNFNKSLSDADQDDFQKYRRHNILGLNEEKIESFYQNLIAEYKDVSSYDVLNAQYDNYDRQIREITEAIRVYSHANKWYNRYSEQLFDTCFIGLAYSFGWVWLGPGGGVVCDLIAAVPLYYRDRRPQNITPKPSYDLVPKLMTLRSEIETKMRILRTNRPNHIYTITNFILDQQTDLLKHIYDNIKERLDDTKQKFVIQFDNLRENIQRKTTYYEVDPKLLTINLNLFAILHHDHKELAQACKGELRYRVREVNDFNPIISILHLYRHDREIIVHRLFQEYTDLIRKGTTSDYALQIIKQREVDLRKEFIDQCNIKPINFKERRNIKHYFRFDDHTLVLSTHVNISSILEYFFDEIIRELVYWDLNKIKFDSVNIELSSVNITSAEDELRTQLRTPNLNDRQQTLIHERFRDFKRKVVDIDDRIKNFFISDIWRLNELEKIFKIVGTAILNGSDEKFLHYKLKYILGSAEGNDPASIERINRTFYDKYKKLGFNDPIQFLRDCDMKPLIFISKVENRIARVNDLYERFKSTILLYYIIVESGDEFDSSKGVELIYKKINNSFETLKISPEISRLNLTGPEFVETVCENAILETERWLNEIAQTFPIEISAREINLVINKLRDYFNNTPLIRQLLQDNITNYFYLKKKLPLFKKISDENRLSDEFLNEIVTKYNNDIDIVKTRIEHQNILMQKGVPITREAAEQLLVENNSDLIKALEHKNRSGLSTEPQTPHVANAANAQILDVNRRVMDFLNH